MRYSGLIFLAIAFLYLGAFGIYGLGRNQDYRQVDMGYLYTAGVMWQEGKNPYHFEEFKRASEELGLDIQTYNFAYPPSIAPLSLFLAQFSLEGARIAMIAINSMSLFLLIYGVIRLTPSFTFFQHALLASLLIANPFTAHVFWMGQTSLIAAAGIMMLWLYRESRLLYAAFFGAIASIKPQLSIFPLLWLLFEKRGRLFVLICIFGLLFSSFSFTASHPITVFSSWIESLSVNVGLVAESNHSRNLVFSLESFFWSIGVEAPFLIYIGFALFFILFLLRGRYNNLDKLSLLVTLSPLFLYSHDYDLVVLAPFLASFIYYMQDSRYKWLSIIALLSFYVPQRLFRDAPVLALGHIREWVLFALFFWLAHLGFYYGLTRSKTK